MFGEKLILRGITAQELGNLINILFEHSGSLHDVAGFKVFVYPRSDGTFFVRLTRRQSAVFRDWQTKHGVISALGDYSASL